MKKFLVLTKKFKTELQQYSPNNDYILDEFDSKEEAEFFLKAYKETNEYTFDEIIYIHDIMNDLK